jgi:hypothetical protein
MAQTGSLSSAVPGPNGLPQAPPANFANPADEKRPICCLVGVPAVGSKPAPRTPPAPKKPQQDSPCDKEKKIDPPPCPPQAGAPGCKDTRSCIELEKAASEESARLREAEAAVQDKQWDVAATKYLAVISKATNSSRRADAETRYKFAREQMRTWWWRWGKYFPPLRWVHGRLWPTVIVLGILLLLLLAPKILRGTGVFALLGRVLEFAFMPRFRGRAQVIAPTSLTDGSPVNLFAVQLPVSAMEVRRRWKRASLSFLSGGTTLLALPTALADQINQSFPKVYNIDVSKYLAFIFVIGRYFGWRLESQLAYCPDPPAAAGTKSGPGRMCAFGTLRWGWFIYATFSVAPKAAGPLDSEKAAYALAARVIGAARRKV